jgi:hypothetical protein
MAYTEGYTDVTVWNEEEGWVEISVKWAHSTCMGTLEQEAEDEVNVLSWTPEFDWLDEYDVEKALHRELYKKW